MLWLQISHGFSKGSEVEWFGICITANPCCFICFFFLLFFDFILVGANTRKQTHTVIHVRSTGWPFYWSFEAIFCWVMVSEGLKGDYIPGLFHILWKVFVHINIRFYLWQWYVIHAYIKTQNESYTDNMWHHGFQPAVWIGHHILLTCKGVEEKYVNHIIITMIQVCWSYAWSCADMHTYSPICWQTIYICVWLLARHELQH